VQAKLGDVSSGNQPVPGPYLALKGSLRGLMHSDFEGTNSRKVFEEPYA
jgi:hypothetical protein